MLLVIDNYDSFTYNVVRYLVELGAQVEVRRNDEVDLHAIERLNPQGLVISPGPCSPNEAGISLAAIQHFADKIPILGVCLGHQALGQVYGANVVRARTVMHGKTSVLHHDNTGLFESLPRQFRVARYHSLILEETSLPPCLKVDAWSFTLHNIQQLEGYVGNGKSLGSATAEQTREIMAISHTDLPLHGVQFHPEAILSEQGHALFEQFLAKYNLH